jgi:hypothetical protein
MDGAALMSPTTYFQVIPLRPRLTAPKGFYTSRKDISSWEGQEKELGMGTAMSTPKSFEKIVQLPNLYPVMTISHFGKIP